MHLRRGCGDGKGRVSSAALLQLYVDLQSLAAIVWHSSQATFSICQAFSLTQKIELP